MFNSKILEFTTFGSTADEVRLKNSQNSTKVRYYVETAEWAITRNYVAMDVEIADGSSYPVISFHFSLERTCNSCIINTLLPVIIHTRNSEFVVVYRSYRKRRKVDVSNVCFLNFSCVLTIIMISLPESVDGMSYLCIFVTLELVVSAITLLFTVLTLRLHHEMGDMQIPHYAKLMVKIFRRSCITTGRGKQCSASNTAG